MNERNHDFDYYRDEEDAQESENKANNGNDATTNREDANPIATAWRYIVISRSEIKQTKELFESIRAKKAKYPVYLETYNNVSRGARFKAILNILKAAIALGVAIIIAVIFFSWAIKKTLGFFTGLFLLAGILAAWAVARANWKSFMESVRHAHVQASKRTRDEAKKALGKSESKNSLKEELEALKVEFRLLTLVEKMVEETITAEENEELLALLSEVPKEDHEALLASISSQEIKLKIRLVQVRIRKLTNALQAEANKQAKSQAGDSATNQANGQTKSQVRDSATNQTKNPATSQTRTQTQNPATSQKKAQTQNPATSRAANSAAGQAAKPGQAQNPSATSAPKPTGGNAPRTYRRR